jgi:high-affinity Fe2+/Pb2+ permease
VARRPTPGETSAMLAIQQVKALGLAQNLSEAFRASARACASSQAGQHSDLRTQPNGNAKTEVGWCSPEPMELFLGPWVLATSIYGEGAMNNIIYIIGLVVVVLAVLAFFGLR